MRWVAGFACASLLIAGLASAPSASAATSTSPYVVMLVNGTDPSAVAASVGATPTFVYRNAIDGFAANLTSTQKNQLGKASSVVSITGDDTFGLPDNETPSTPVAQPVQQIPPGVRRIGALQSPTAAIDGVDRRVNVDVAVMDTGIDLHHPDLNVVGGVDCGAGNGYDDGNGHGTHVAGTIGALDNGIGVVGVAPGARLWSVRVFNKSGKSSNSRVICGIDWITAHSDVIHLVNYSGGGKGIDDGACGTSTNGPAQSTNPLHAAICDSVAHGVTYVVGAGNNASDASTFVPAAFDEVIAVSAFADYDGVPGGLANPPCFGQWPYKYIPPIPDDTFASFSNYGPDVDFTAPGVCVLSTLPGGNYGLDTGTSMAAPHVTGAAALYLANHPGASPAQVKQALLNNADYSGITGDPDVPPTPIVNAAGF